MSILIENKYKCEEDEDYEYHLDDPIKATFPLYSIDGSEPHRLSEIFDLLFNWLYKIYKEENTMKEYSNKVMSIAKHYFKPGMMVIFDRDNGGGPPLNPETSGGWEFGIIEWIDYTDPNGKCQIRQPSGRPRSRNLFFDIMMKKISAAPDYLSTLLNKPIDEYDPGTKAWKGED